MPSQAADKIGEIKVGAPQTVRSLFVAIEANYRTRQYSDNIHSSLNGERMKISCLLVELEILNAAREAKNE